MRFLCDNLRAKKIMFEYKLRHFMARVRYVKSSRGWQHSKERFCKMTSFTLGLFSNRSIYSDFICKCYIKIGNFDPTQLNLTLLNKNQLLLYQDFQMRCSAFL